MSEIVLREKADGTGVSACRSPEGKVGRGRCNHVNSDIHMVLKKDEEQRDLYVLEISDEYDKISIEAKKDTIRSFINKLGRLDQEKIDSIMKKLK